MYRTVGGVLVLLLALPALRADDKPKETPTTPKEQYNLLLKEQNDAMRAYQQAYREAKTQEEKNKVVQEKYPNPAKAAPKFLELAEKNPKDPVAVDALIWVVTNGAGSGKDNPRTKALAMLREHVTSDKMNVLCQTLSYDNDKESLDLLRDILAKNTNKDVQVEAALAVAQRLTTTAQLARRLKDSPADAKRYEGFYGKDYVEGLLKTDLAKIDAEIVALYKEIGEKHAPAMKTDRLVQLCQRVGQTGAVGGERLLLTLLEHDERREVQGVASLALAESFKARADALPEAKAKEAEKLRKESEDLFERAADKYGDVKLPFRGTVGDKAKGELFELRFLSVGKVAPEIEGEDPDSKKFKLTEYRGKVVMLDFWGHW